MPKMTTEFVMYNYKMTTQENSRNVRQRLAPSPTPAVTLQPDGQTALLPPTQTVTPLTNTTAPDMMSALQALLAPMNTQLEGMRADIAPLNIKLEVLAGKVAWLEGGFEDGTTTGDVVAPALGQTEVPPTNADGARGFSRANRGQKQGSAFHPYKAG